MRSDFCLVDSEDFQSKCRVPLIAGGWNVWHLAISNRHATSPEKIKELVRWCLNWWFGQIPGGSKVWTDNFDSYSIRVIPAGKIPPSSWTILGADGKPVNPQAEYTQTASSRDVERLTCTNSVIDVDRDWTGVNPFLDAWVEFVYRGTSNSMPWPAWKEGFQWLPTGPLGAPKPELVNDWCPTDANIVLAESYRFTKPKAVPSKPTVIGQILPETLDPTKTVSGAVFWGIIGIGTVYMVSSAISSRAERWIP
jgi:hypothetical protein